jgi:hypothetical protein
MRRSKICAPIFSAAGVIAVLLVIASSLPAQKSAGTGTDSRVGAPAPAGVAQNPDQSKTSWADFSWLEGRWQGNWGPRLAEQIWMTPKADEMAGVFREVENDKTLVLELFSVVETPEGIEYRSRHFTPSLAPWEQSGPTVLKLASIDPNQIVFENTVDGKPKRVVLTRTSPDTYVSRSEIVPDQGDTQVVEITYRRQTVSGGSAGRR